MKIAIVTDSSCDIPDDLLAQYDIREVPFKVVIGSTVRYDNRLDLHRDEFYENDFKSKRSSISVEPPGVDDFVQMYKRLCLSYDSILSIHQSAKFSDVMKHARAAALQSAEAMKKARSQRNIVTPFQVRVLDSKSTSVGLGLLVLRAAELISEDIYFTKLAMELETLADQIYLYVVPDDVSFLRTAKGQQQVSFLESRLAAALDQKPMFLYNKAEITKLDKKKGSDSAVKEMLKLALERMDGKTSYDKVGIAYAGRLSDIEQHSAVSEFRIDRAGSGVGSVVCPLSPALGVSLGSKTLAVAVITGDINAAQLRSK
jgi:DegV family protein with EDD domain